MTDRATAALDRARGLAARIAATAERIERERRLPDDLVTALHEAGMFRLLLPRTRDGQELDPPTFVGVIETLARADASTAWVVCQTAGCSMIAAYLEPETAARVFGPRGVLAWGAGPQGRAVAVDGGFRLTGRWSFASGIRHATWVGAHAPVVEVDGSPRRRADGAPVVRTLLLPVDRTSVTDVWDVLGLRGTGSDTYGVEDVFVPAEHTTARDDADERREPGTLYCFPTSSLYAGGFAGVGLGVAQALLDDFVTMARDKTPRGARLALRDSPVVQAQVADVTARLQAARTYLLSTLAETWDEVSRRRELTLAQRVRVRLAASHALREAREAGSVVYHAAGATAIFASGAFERRFRDLHTVAQQVQARDDHFETVGRFLLGLPPDSQFL